MGLAAAGAGALAVAGAAGPAATVDIIGLQAQRDVQRLDGPAERVALTHLNPAANAWFLLEVQRPGAAPLRWHLENPWPHGQRLLLAQQRDGVVLQLQRDGEATVCAPWREDGAASSPKNAAYLPLCQGRVLRRLAVGGRRTALEAATDLLRDHVWGGDRLVGFVQRQLFADRYVEHAAAAASAAAGAKAAPPAARRRDPATPAFLSAAGLGLALDDAPERQVAAGAWHALTGHPGVFASVYRPADLPPPRPATPAPDAV